MKEKRLISQQVSSVLKENKHWPDDEHAKRTTIKLNDSTLRGALSDITHKSLLMKSKRQRNCEQKNYKYRLSLVFTLFISLLILFENSYSQNSKEEILTNAADLLKDDQAAFLNKSAEKFFFKDYETAKILCTKALEISREIENDTLCAQSHKYLAFINRNTGLYETALEHAEQAIRLYINLRDSMELGFSYSLSGSSYNFLGNKEGALEAFINGEKVFLEILEREPENRNIEKRLAILYNDMGLFYISPLKDYSKAHDYFQEGLTLVNHLADSMQINSFIANIGLTHYKQKNYDKALIYYRKALKMATRLNNHMFAANISNNIARVYMDEGKISQAKNYYMESLEVYKKIKSVHHIGKVQLDIGRIWLIEQNYVEAINWLSIALDNLQQSKGNLELLEVNNLLSECYSKMNNYHLAMKYFKDYATLKDSINEKESEKRYEKLSIKYETEKKEKENAQLRMTNKINEITLSKDKVIISGLSFGLFIVSVLSLVVYLLVARKNKALKALVQQNIESAKCDSLAQKLHINKDLIQTKTRFNTPEVKADIKNDLLDRLLNYMVDEKPFLDSKMSLDTLAIALNTNRSYLSKTINENLDKNFYDLMNEYRLKESRLLLMDDKYNHLSIDGICSLSGFASRSTFYNHFKKQFGISPTYFRNSLAKSDKSPTTQAVQ